MTFPWTIYTNIPTFFTNCFLTFKYTRRICTSVGWKMTFIIIGILAPLWVLPWLWLRKSNPKNHPFITDEEKQYILSGQPETKVTDDKGLSWGQLLAKRKSYAVILSRFFLDPVWWMFVT